MQTLNSLGDEAAEGYELGKRLNPIMHECDYKERCFERRIKPILAQECQNPQRFGFQDSEQCLFEMTAAMKQALKLKKEMLGI